MDNLDPAVVERMVALVREHAASSSPALTAIKARALVAELPAPTDPDLLEARKIGAQWYRVGSENRGCVLEGREDHTLNVKLALAAIKRGRELASGHAARATCSERGEG